jgi:hypothetical protein
MADQWRSMIAVALALVAIVLGIGLWALLRGGNPRRSQKLMRWRVILQVAALALIMAAAYFTRTG